MDVGTVLANHTQEDERRFNNIDMKLYSIEAQMASIGESLKVVSASIQEIKTDVTKSIDNIGNRVVELHLKTDESTERFNDITKGNAKDVEWLKWWMKAVVGLTFISFVAQLVFFLLRSQS